MSRNGIHVFWATCVVAAIAASAAPAAAQNGLVGRYYDDHTQNTATAVTRVDQQVVFPDFPSPPVAGMTNDDTIFIRWQGMVQAPAAGNVRFWLRADDGARLWVNGVLVMDRWQQGGVPGVGDLNPSAIVAMPAGAVSIRAEMYEEGGGEGAILQWDPLGGTAQVDIPALALTPVIAPPRITPGTGAQTSSVVVRISSDHAEGTIHFTTNGVDPTTGDPVYTGPFAVGATTTVKAIVANSTVGYLAATSAVTTSTITVNDSTGPALTTVRSIAADQLLLTFSEVLSAASANTTGNYTISGGVVVTAAAQEPGLRTVRLTCTGLVAGTSYVLTMANLQDRDPAPNTMAAANDRSFTHRPPTATALVDWFRLDEGTGTTFADASGSGSGGNAGNLQSPTGPPVWIDGVQGSALSFNGISSELVTGQGMQAVLGQQSSSTITFWMRVPVGTNGRVTGGNERNGLGVIGHSHNAGTEDVVFGYLNGGQLRVRIGDAPVATAAVNVNDGNWHHVAITRDMTSGNINAWVDGIQRITNVVGTIGTTNQTVDRIGRILDTETAALKWHGDLDEIRIHNAVLTQTDVYHLVNQPPVITAASATPTATPQQAALASTFTDDGIPLPATLTWTWSLVSGPGTATFVPAPPTGTGSPGNATVTVTQGGTYVFRITVSDGLLSTSRDVTVTFARVSVTPVAGLITTEAGGTAQFTIVLTQQPATDVVLDIATSDATEGLVSTVAFPTPAANLQMTFTNANWNTAQTVTITGQDDALNDGDIPYTITVTVNAAASDNVFDTETPADPAVTNTDNDVPALLVMVTPPLITGEDGTFDTFDLVLQTQPTANVSIVVSSSNPAEGLVSTLAFPVPAGSVTVTFTNANWNIPQTVTVTGQDDLLVDLTVAYLIQFAPSTSTDGDYNGLDPADIPAQNVDDEAIPPAPEAWGDCGLLGVEFLLPLGLLALRRRKRAV
jgi:hypothetical protein